MTEARIFRDIRPSPLAGRWYPAAEAQLARTVDQYISRASLPPVPGPVIGVLAPHAGHVYSGGIAGCAFRAVQGMDVEVVAVVGPSHYAYPADLLTTAHDAFETPLGTVPVDRRALDALGELVPLSPVRADPEHAIEIELPFLQRVLDDFTLIPIALVDQSLTMATRLGRALGEILAGRRALLVASSDLSHFYPEDQANVFDQALLAAVETFDPAAVIDAELKGRGFACGHGAIATVMVAARALGADTARVVGYATSGATTGDFKQVVGYGAALFYRAGEGPPA